MRFKLTMNMGGAQNDSSTHQVIADHPAASISEFAKALRADDFIEVDEVHRDGGHFRSAGPLVLNTFLVGKVKVFEDRPHGR